MEETRRSGKAIFGIRHGPFYWSNHFGIMGQVRVGMSENCVLNYYSM